MENIEAQLRECPVFADLDPRLLAVIADCASPAQFEASHFVFREGEEADTCYLIRRGRVALEVFAPGRGPLTIQTVGEGEVLGWSWLIAPYRWQFDARTTELTRALALDGRCLRAKCEGDYQLGYELMKRFADVIRQRLQATRMQLLDLYGAGPGKGSNERRAR